MGIHIYGNDPNQNLTVASGDISGNLVIFGNGAGDHVLAENGNISHDIITFSDVAGIGIGFATADFVIASGAISNDIITFGNAFSDSVKAQGGDITHSVITFGDGGGDFVFTPFNLNQDTITFGNHTLDSVNTLGDTVTAGDANQDVFVFGQGSGDRVVLADIFNEGGAGNLSNSSIAFHDIASDDGDGGLCRTVRAAAGGPAAAARPRPLCRGSAAAGHAACRVRAQRARAWPHPGCADQARAPCPASPQS